MADRQNEKILQLLQEKMELKQEVYDNTKIIFEKLKKQLAELVENLSPSVKSINEDLTVSINERNEFEAQFTLADETLLFVMHTNIFTFDSSHEMWKSQYVIKDPKRSYCGKIFIYNFLSDSFKYTRLNDVGYLIARIFVNRENHYFVEGEKQLGYLYSDFSTTELNDENLSKVIETAILYTLDFDPFTPSFEPSTEISIREIIDSSLQAKIVTGKRLGFKFQTDNDFKL